MKTFRESILESDPCHYAGAIIRDSDFKIIKVGQFEVGKNAKYTTPVREENDTIIRFELPYAVFNGGRVEVARLEGFVVNPLYAEYSNKIQKEYNQSKLSINH